MPFYVEDRHTIKVLRESHQYGATRLTKMFPNKQWTLDGLKTLIKNIDRCGTVERCCGSGRPRSARCDDNIDDIGDLVLSQESAPHTHSSQRQIARHIDISISSVNRIIHKDLIKCLKKRRVHESLTAANQISCRTRSLQLLRRYPASMVNFIRFSDEKVFTVAAPSNSQNDRVYVPLAARKRQVSAERLLRTRPTFTQSVMVSVAMSALGRTSIHFVDPGVKINGKYYREVLLTRDLLPDIRQYSEYFIFQHDGAPVHRARETVELLKEVMPDFIPPSLWPPNSPDLNPVDYATWGIMQERVYNKGKIANVEELRQHIVDEWERLDQHIIDGAVKEWRKQLRACAAAEGGQFEHEL